jgi:MiaB-like tRNA modifying enzyme
MKKTAAFLSLGCKVNSYETEAMRQMFEAAGYDIVDFKEIADVYVINTCTVTNIADRKSRQMLHQAKSRNPKAVIAAVGCYVQAAEEVLLADDAVDLIVGNNKKSDIVSMVERCMGTQNKEELVVEINDEREYEELNVSTTTEKTRAFIKIQDGCNRFCSYCIIPYVRGRVRSRKEGDILAEITELVQQGYKEIVLTGIHISSYGTDFQDEEGQPIAQERMPLAELIVRIGNIDGIERIRLGSLEPRIITSEFLNKIAKVKAFCPHFHLSLQSGSDTVLQRMNRKYTAQDYYERVLLIHKYFEQPAFTTDIIVGFPGETDEEFKDTLEFVKKIGFSHIHVFKYSKREGTKASKMPGQIPEEIKNLRSNILIKLSELLSKEYKAGFLGKIEKVLFEEEFIFEERRYQLGHNERYLKLAVPVECDLSNQIFSVKVCNYLTEDVLLCEIIH